MRTPEKENKEEKQGGGGLFASIREVFSLSVFSAKRKDEADMAAEQDYGE